LREYYLFTTDFWVKNSYNLGLVLKLNNLKEILRLKVTKYVTKIWKRMMKRTN